MDDRPLVMVFGSAGFLGRAVLRALNESGQAHLAVARQATGGAIACDLSRPGEVIACLDRFRPGSIVNCAAQADFGPGVLSRLYPVNALAPGVMAGWAAQAGSYLLQVSATLVHGVRATGIDADSPLDPDTDYGRSKLLAEELIGASGASALCLRLGGIIGMEGPEHLSLNRVLRGAAAGRKPQVSGRGIARRSYIHVDDAARAIVDALDRRTEGIARLGGLETLSIAEVMQLVCDVWMPGLEPEFITGGEASDQVVQSSATVLQARPLREALLMEKTRIARKAR